MEQLRLTDEDLLTPFVMPAAVIPESDKGEDPLGSCKQELGKDKEDEKVREVDKREKEKEKLRDVDKREKVRDADKGEKEKGKAV